MYDREHKAMCVAVDARTLPPNDDYVTDSNGTVWPVVDQIGVDEHTVLLDGELMVSVEKDYNAGRFLAAVHDQDPYGFVFGVEGDYATEAEAVARGVNTARGLLRLFA